jgi:hypothetical protein
MADSERTFADYVGKAKLVKSATEGFDPAFNSQNPDDSPLVFGARITDCENKNVAVGESRIAYSNGAVDRKNLVKDVKNRAMRSMTNVKSVEVYKPYAKGIEVYYRKLRNYKVPGAKKPDPDKKKRNKGEQSFADIENHYKTFLVGLTAIPGYTHQDDNLKLPALNSLYTKFHNSNILMSDLDATESRLTSERFEMFHKPGTGLKDRILSVKDAVKNQYGLDSTQYASIKSIKV